MGLRPLLLTLTLLILLTSVRLFHEKTPGRPQTSRIAGKATWYRDHILSSGKPFRDGAYAAMRGVPLGAKVRVTSIKTGKSVIVTVNDRGPSEEHVKKGRVIDLARRAFLDLTGDLDIGEENVVVEIQRRDMF